MNPPNTIASDTLVEAVARAMGEARLAARRANDERLIAEGFWPNPHFEPPREMWAAAVITAIADAGMAIVPREPTEAMIAAGQLEAEGCTDDWTASAACLSGHVWSAMLAMHAATHCNNNGKAE